MKGHHIPTVAALSAVLVLAGSCSGFKDGPPLNVDVPTQSLALTPTTGDPMVCCCRITGTVLNRSSVPVHVTVTFDVYRSGEDEPAGSAVDFLRNVDPNELRPISATGLLEPCSEFDEIDLVDVDIRGVWFP